MPLAMAKMGLPWFLCLFEVMSFKQTTFRMCILLYYTAVLIFNVKDNVDFPTFTGK